MLMKSAEALDRLLSKPGCGSVLDVGCGTGIHSERLRAAGKTVTSIDFAPLYDKAIVADYLKHEFDQPFDALWISHVLEHQVNVNFFLKKAFRDLKPGGLLVLTVPPLKHSIVGGHVTLWNAGLLLYNLIMAGFDCSHAELKCYDYNISVIVPAVAAPIETLGLYYDSGDIEKLAPYFPKLPDVSWKQSFNGQIEQINWDRPGINYVDTDRSFVRWVKKILTPDYWFPQSTPLAKAG